MNDFTLPAIARWLSLVSIWVFIGSFAGRFIELKGWMNFISVLTRPLVRLGRLPPVAGAAFLAAFGSGPAAQSMLADAFKVGLLTRSQMYLCAVACSFPNKFSHLMRPLYRFIALLGPIAVIYTALQIVIDVLMALCAFLMCRVLNPQSSGAAANPEPAVKPKPAMDWLPAAKASLKSASESLIRVMLIAAPVYVIVAYLSHRGCFARAEELLPDAAREIFSKDVLKIMFAKMAGLTGSAAVAAKLLTSGSVTKWQVLLALVAANTITIPFSTLRRNIPVSVGIFPGVWGLWIVLTSQTFRILLNLLALLLLIMAGAY